MLAVTAWTGASLGAPSLKMGQLRPVDIAPKKMSTNLFFPTLASDGNGWLAVAGTTGTRIQANGLPAGDGFVVASGDEFWSMDSHVVFDGVDFVIAFQIQGAPRGIGLQRVTAAGLGATTILDLHGDWTGIDLAADQNGVDHLLACESGYVESICYTAELDRDSATVYPGFEVPFPITRVHWAFSGETALAIVERENHAVMLLDISAEGELLDSQTLEDASGGAAAPTIARSPTGYSAAWQRSDGIRVVGLSPEGDVTADELVAGDGSASHPVLVPMEDAWLLLWDEESAACDDCVDINAQRLDPQLAKDPGEPVVVAESAYAGAVAAATGSKVLVVFPSPDSLDATLLDVAQLTPKPKRVPTAFTTPPQGAPITANTKDGWVVAWLEQDEIRNVLVDFDGVPRPSPLQLPAKLWRLEAGDGDWLMVSGTDAGVQCTRLDEAGTPASEPYTLPNTPYELEIARSAAGWAVVWSHWLNTAESALEVDFFDRLGVHQSSTRLATRNVGGGAIYSIPFDLAATAAGFEVGWSTPLGGVESLRLDGTAHAGSRSQIFRYDADALNIAVTPQASWLAFSIGSTNYFAPAGQAPQYDPGSYEYLMELRAVGEIAVLASADRYAGFEGTLRLASPGEFPQDSQLKFPTYATAYGFTLSKASGNRALLVTQATQYLYGNAQSRLAAAVVTVDQPLASDGGAAGGGGSDDAVGGSRESSRGGAGGSRNGMGGSHEAAEGGDEGLQTSGGAPQRDGTSANTDDASSGAPTESGGDEMSLSHAVAFGGCGCRLCVKPQPGGAGLLLLGVGTILRCRRRRNSRSPGV